MPELNDTTPLDGFEHPRLIVGCGDVGRRVAMQLKTEGLDSLGLVCSAASAESLARAGIEALRTDLDAGAPLPSARQLFWFAPPADQAEAETRLRSALAQMRRPPQRIIYISTSGVYGDCQGRWIDEDEPLKPQTSRGRRRLDAERALHEYAAREGTEIVVLRVPGIYGPGRLPLEQLRRGLPVVRADESPYTNRIHADDLASAAIAAARRGRAGQAYNVSDGDPTTMADYFGRCAALLELPPPPEVSMAEARRSLTPAMLSFLEESKRLLTHRLRQDLRFHPRYPNLQSGLPACLD